MDQGVICEVSLILRINAMSVYLRWHCGVTNTGEIDRDQLHSKLRDLVFSDASVADVQKQGSANCIARAGQHRVDKTTRPFCREGLSILFPDPLSSRWCGAEQ